MIKRNFQEIILFPAILLMILLVSCNPSKKYEEQEQVQIQDYLVSNPNLNFELKPSGLYYLEVQTGTGRVPVAHDTVFIKYTGTFLTGQVFGTNIGTTDTLIFPLNEDIRWMIDGIEEGITYMKQGGISRFMIPSKLAYGPSGYYSIPGYTPLLYEVNLVLVKPGPAK